MKLRSLAAVLLVYGVAGQTPPSPSPSLTLLSKDGRRSMPVTLVGDQEFVALDELATVFQLAIREDSLGAITVSYKGKTIVLTPDQALASVAGKLISLPAAPFDEARGRPGRGGRRWLVPVELISRALSLIYDARLELRKPSHLVMLGDVRVPRVLIRYELLGTGARMTIDATPRAGSTVSQENDRLTIRFDADALDIALPVIQAQGLVQGIRLADPVALAVDLGPRFAAFRAVSQPMETSTRLTIDIVATQTDAIAPTPSPAPAPPPDLNAMALAAASMHTIAIDAGHGGDDHGATSAGGVKEKDLTLAVARRLKGTIESRLGIRVLLTRDDDRNVPANDRTALANNNKADIFVSLHAAAALRPATAGASIFIAAFDKDAEDRARAELRTEPVPTFSGGQRDIELLLWDLAQIRHLEQSAELAKIIERQFRERLPLSTHALGRAPLRVLESANMPAVLVEMGYLTNADQEKQLTGNDFQSTLVQALADSVVKFRDYLGGSPPVASGVSAKPTHPRAARTGTPR